MPDKFKESSKIKKEIISCHFNDNLSFDKETKTAISFRDGVLEYLGSELGLEPQDKVFTVYRSPATIANASRLMANLPLTDEHVPLDEYPSNPVGEVEQAEMVDLFDEKTKSSVGVKNKISVTDMIKGALNTGKRELSLGYGADLFPHSLYDFEQKDILPHHLAVVQAGRCGSACAFIDRKPLEDSNMPKEKQNGQQGKQSALIKIFTDAEGQPNLEQIVEIAQGLPEALRKLPMDQLQKVMPQLQEIVSMAKGEAPQEQEVAVEDEESENTDEEASEKKEEYTDSSQFKDAVALAVKDYADKLSSVIDKAKGFVDAKYNYAGKTANEIMRDSLATEHGDTKFADAELEVAFKLLKKPATNFKDFGDGANPEQVDQWSAAADKEL